MIKGVIFDMDGLMFDTERLSTEGWLYAGEKCGYAITRELIDSTRGQARNRTKKMMEDLFGSDFDFGLLTDISRDYMDAVIEKEGLPVKEGLFQLLKVLNENNYKKAVATSTERHRVEKLLLEANLIHNFDAIICGDEVENGKPEPEIFIRAAHRLGLAPEECLGLAYSSYGVLAAWKCRAKPVLIRIGSNAGR